MYLCVCNKKHGYCVISIFINFKSGYCKATHLYIITRFWIPVLCTLCTPSLYHSEKGQKIIKLYKTTKFI